MKPSIDGELVSGDELRRAAKERKKPYKLVEAPHPSSESRTEKQPKSAWERNRRMFSRYKHGEKIAELAEAFDLTDTHIRRIVRALEMKEAEVEEELAKQVREAKQEKRRSRRAEMQALALAHPYLKGIAQCQ